MSSEEKDLKPKTVKLGFDAKGKPYPGVDAKSGERVTVTLPALKDEFGPKRGEEMYRQISAATQTGDLFGDVGVYAPDIQIKGAPDSVRIKVDEILAAKE